MTQCNTEIQNITTNTTNTLKKQYNTQTNNYYNIPQITTKKRTTN